MSSRPWRFALASSIAWLCAYLGAAPVVADAQAPSQPPGAQFATLTALQPKLDCANLTSVDVSAAVGAPTQITSATPVTEGLPSPQCDVRGTIDQTIGFQVVLPIAGWTQRFLQTGCGGFCGSLTVRVENAANCTPATNGELVLAASNMGHTGQMSDASAMAGPQARIDFAYRGQHLTTVAAKALAEKYYGQKPRYSYFSGCSDGGREALMAAQRYPNDFDGILSGDPASNFISQNTFGSAWSRYVNAGPDGKPIFTADKLSLLHDAVLAKCDAADGAKDGLISDPIGCRFDAAVIQCKAGEDAKTCLSPAQVKVVNEIYAGPHDAAGNRLAPGGLLPGSEVNWAGPVVPGAGEPVGVSEMAESAFKYLAYEPNPAAGASSRDLKFDRASFEKTNKLATLYDATNPDLSAFKAHGGKLILYHGLADPAISPLNTIAYFEAMQSQMGKAAVGQFSRLYLFPGVSHCGGGEGPFNPDFLSAIMGWVEKSIAPQAILAARYPSDPKIIVGLTPIQQQQARQAAAGAPQAANGGMGPGPGAAPGPGGPNAGPPGGGNRRPTLPKPPTETAESTLPIFPYPVTAKYTGTGSMSDAKNFVAGPASPMPAAWLKWLGASTYKANREVWCTAAGAALSCKNTP